MASTQTILETFWNAFLILILFSTERIHAPDFSAPKSSSAHRNRVRRAEILFGAPNSCFGENIAPKRIRLGLVGNRLVVWVGW